MSDDVKVFELPVMSFGSEPTIAAGDESQWLRSGPFRYDVDKSSTDWIVTFRQVSRIRFHASQNHAPYTEMWVQPKTERLKVRPGQWLSAQVDGSWSRLSDADHR